jgi:putative PIN family toxin of toxin-antitoxin system
MLDTNILISAIYNPTGIPFDAFRKASQKPYSLVLCDQILDELRRIFNRKFPQKIPNMERFLAAAHYDIITLREEDFPHESENAVRDKYDRPILRAALKARAEILVTGDKDFLVSGVNPPKILTARQFVDDLF